MYEVSKLDCIDILLDEFLSSDVTELMLLIELETDDEDLLSTLLNALRTSSSLKSSDMIVNK